MNAESAELAADNGAVRGALYALIVCQIGLHACVQGARLAVPLSVLKMGYDAWSVGVVMMMFAMIPALLAIPAGRLADRRGYHFPVRIAAALSLSGAVVGALVPSFPALCIAAALCGAGAGFGMIVIQRTAGRFARNDADGLRVFSWIALAPALAGLLGPLLAGALIDQFGFRIAFAGLAVLPLISILVTRAVPHEAPVAVDARVRKTQSLSQILKTPGFARLLFINWLVSASWDVHGFALPVLGVERGLSASTLGMVLAAYAVASMAVRLAIPFIAEHLPRRHLLPGALALTCLVFVLYPLLHSAWAMAGCAAVLGIALGTIQPAILTTLHKITPRQHHGEALALRSMSVHLSMMGMPLIFGLIGASVGAAALFWVMAVSLGIGSLEARRLAEKSE